MGTTARNAWGIIISNAIICLSVLFFGGNIYLLLFSYLFEILIAFLFIFLIIYGARGDTNDVIGAGAIVVIGIGYVIYNYFELMPRIIPFAFAETFYKTWSFWTIFAALFIGQLFSFNEKFIQPEDKKLPAPDYFAWCFVLQSAVIIIVTGGVLPLTKVIAEHRTTIYVFAGMKAVLELLLLLPALSEKWSYETRYNFFMKSRR